MLGDAYEAALSEQNKGTKCMIAVTCGYAFEYESSQGHWIDLLRQYVV
jgi:hypothetical protein